jgi:beta-glucosidase
LIQSDWGAAYNATAAALAGLDYVEGSNYATNAIWANLDTLISNGTLPKDILDDKIVRVLTPYYALNQSSFPETDFSRSVVSPYHDSLIRNVSANAITLLKNNQTRNIYNTPTTDYRGQVTGGFGSGGVYAPYTVTPVEAITARGRKASPPIFVDGYYDK